MKARSLTLPNTSYDRMTVWDGEYHEAGFRFLAPAKVKRDRGFMHVCVQNAAGFDGTRHLTRRRAARGKWHRFAIGRRDLARAFLIEIEPLVRLGLIQVEFDGETLRTR